MSRYFGNAVVLNEDIDDGGTFDAVGQILTIQPPNQEWDLVSFLALGDTVDPMHISPVLNAPEWECAIYMDRNESGQTKIDAAVGSDTAHSYQLVYPFSANNTADFEAKIYATEVNEIASKEAIIKVYRFVNTTDITWS